jgi:hypothetical protein
MSLEPLPALGRRLDRRLAGPRSQGNETMSRIADPLRGGTHRRLIESGQRQEGVAGGLAGRVFHGQLIKAEPSMRLAAVVTRDPQRRVQAAAEHPGVSVHDSLD